MQDRIRGPLERLKEANISTCRSAGRMAANIGSPRKPRYLTIDYLRDAWFEGYDERRKEMGLHG
jgi:hypothetical protein